MMHLAPAQPTSESDMPSMRWIVDGRILKEVRGHAKSQVLALFPNHRVGLMGSDETLNAAAKRLGWV